MNRPRSRLLAACKRICKNHISEYDSPDAFFKDLSSGGCASGMISELVYYHSTLDFYNKHKKEIQELLLATMDERGVKNPSELFGDKWDKEDFFANETNNQNLLAWFSFEEMAYHVAQKMGVRY